MSKLWLVMVLVLVGCSSPSSGSSAAGEWYAFSDSKPYTTDKTTDFSVSWADDEEWVSQCRRCCVEGKALVRHVCFYGYIPEGAYLPRHDMVLCYECAPPGNKKPGSTNWFEKWNIGERNEDCVPTEKADRPWTKIESFSN